jgi:hypothetical protein
MWSRLIVTTAISLIAVNFLRLIKAYPNDSLMISDLNRAIPPEEKKTYTDDELNQCIQDLLQKLNHEEQREVRQVSSFFNPSCFLLRAIGLHPISSLTSSSFSG